MNTVFKKLDVHGVETRSVDDVPVFPEDSSRDTHPDDLHDRSRAGENSDGATCPPPVSKFFQEIQDGEQIENYKLR